MSMLSTDRLYNLLPAIYRLRDAEQGQPLRALLQVISEQVNLLEEDIARLYDSWFIETCEPWLVPYIGDLVGYRMVHDDSRAVAPGSVRGRHRSQLLTPRREVADTIHNRRRKGTLALLAKLARDVTGWQAYAVEYAARLAFTQAINHLRSERGRTVDLRERQALQRLGGPFDELAHTVDIRRPGSHRTRGLYNLPSIGLFVWRPQLCSVTETAACCLESIGDHRYSFSVLGNDTPLVSRDRSDSVGPLGLSRPLERRYLSEHLTELYGPGQDLAIWVNRTPRRGRRGKPGRADDSRELLPVSDLVVADLSRWGYQPQPGKVAIDPELGRIAFRPREWPKGGVWVSYYHHCNGVIGGGEYDRPLSQLDGAEIYRVGRDQPHHRIASALAAWQDTEPRPRDAVIEITESGVYTESIVIELPAGHSLQIRAANRVRPVIRLPELKADRPDDLAVYGEPGSRLTLDGLIISGHGVHVEGPLAILTIRHCTLVPGWELELDCRPHRPAEASLELADTQARVGIESSIVGSIQVMLDEVEDDPVAISVTDSVLDAADPEEEALGAPGPARPSFSDVRAHAVLTIARSTVLGRIEAHAIDLAENTIFMGKIELTRTQRGCLRFCYVTPGSVTPRRYSCQPDLAEQAAEDELCPANGDPVQEQVQLACERAATRVRPLFESVYYGTPGYCQLAESCAEEITCGADDESEMGVFHDLYQAQRLAGLQVRLEEYTPAGMEPGIILVS